MTREQHIKELIGYLRGYEITMCPASKQYWRKHYQEVEDALSTRWIDCDTCPIYNYDDPCGDGMAMLGDQRYGYVGKRCREYARCDVPNRRQNGYMAGQMRVCDGEGYMAHSHSDA